MRVSFFAIVLISTILISQPLSAFNQGFLKNTVSSYLSQSDKQLFQQALQQALTEVEDGQSRQWHNPENDHNGTIRVNRSAVDTPEGYLKCRQAVIQNNLNKTAGQENKFTFCLPENKIIESADQETPKWRLLQ